MKVFGKILAVWGCIITIAFICLLAVYLDREGIVEFRKQPGVEYYYPADLQAMHLPAWDLTNRIPLSPDIAVVTAMHYASEQHATVVSWEIDRISLENMGGKGIWFYDVLLIDRKSGNYTTSDVRVLMDGNIWRPTSEKR